jgi:hypothetical protein
MKGPFSKGLFLYLNHLPLITEWKDHNNPFIYFKTLALEIYEHRRSVGFR